MGWRLRLLVVAALIGCVAVFALVRAMAAMPHIDASWRTDSRGHMELISSADPALRAHAGKTLSSVTGGSPGRNTARSRSRPTSPTIRSAAARAGSSGFHHICTFAAESPGHAGDCTAQAGAG